MEARSKQRGKAWDGSPIATNTTNSVTEGTVQRDSEAIVGQERQQENIEQPSRVLRAEEGRAVPRDQEPSNRPTVMPGAYREGCDANASHVDSVPATEGTDPGGERDPELPIAQPVSAELVRDGWWRKRRNRYMLIGGHILFEAVLGLAIGFATGSNDKKPSAQTGSGAPGNVNDSPPAGFAPAETLAPTVEAPVPTVETPPPTACLDFEILEDRDFTGYNLFGADKRFTQFVRLNVNLDEAVKECKNICSSIPKCRAFSLVDEGVNNNASPWCFVKDGVPSETPYFDVTSGIRNMDCRRKL